MFNANMYMSTCRGCDCEYSKGYVWVPSAEMFSVASSSVSGASNVIKFPDHKKKRLKSTEMRHISYISYPKDCSGKVALFTWLEAPLPRKRELLLIKITSETSNDLDADYAEEEHFWVNNSRLHDLPIFFLLLLFVMLHVAFLARKSALMLKQRHPTSRET